MSKQDSSRSRFIHETKTRLLEEFFTSSKSGTQSRDWHFSIPKSRDWKSSPGLQSLLTASTAWSNSLAGLI